MATSLIHACAGSSTLVVQNHALYSLKTIFSEEAPFGKGFCVETGTFINFLNRHTFKQYCTHIADREIQTSVLDVGKGTVQCAKFA